jgi:DNA-binding FrmR family transcriptional regulator
MDDRELDAILERLDRLTESVDRIGRRLETTDAIDRVANELASLSRALESLAYAALGTRGPNVRRRPPE